MPNRRSVLFAVENGFCFACLFRLRKTPVDSSVTSGGPCFGLRWKTAGCASSFTASLAFHSRCHQYQLNIMEFLSLGQLDQILSPRQILQRPRKKLWPLVVEPPGPKNIDLRIIIPIIPYFGVRKSTKKTETKITSQLWPTQLRNCKRIRSLSRGIILRVWPARWSRRHSEEVTTSQPGIKVVLNGIAGWHCRLFQTFNSLYNCP